MDTLPTCIYVSRSPSGELRITTDAASHLNPRTPTDVFVFRRAKSFRLSAPIRTEPVPAANIAPVPTLQTPSS